VTQKILLAFHDRFGDILNSAPGGGGEKRIGKETNN